MLEAAYEYLRATPPFVRWKLPHADKVEFRVTDRPDEFGRHGVDERGNHRIDVSGARVRSGSCLVLTMAHEMIHGRQAVLGGDYGHNPLFDRLAAQVCRHHGFDVSVF